MWVVLAVWVICLACIFLPWQGIIFVVLICCMGFGDLSHAFEPSPEITTRKQLNNRGTKSSALAANLDGPSSGAARFGSPLAAIARSFHEATGRLRGDGGGKAEGPNDAVDVVAATENQPKPKARATMLQVGLDQSFFPKF